MRTTITTDDTLHQAYLPSKCLARLPANLICIGSALKSNLFRSSITAALLVGAALSHAQVTSPPQPAGEVKGTAFTHTPQSAEASIRNASLVLPSAATGGAVYAGPVATAPVVSRKVPVVVFLHGSSGLGLKAISEWQLWLAGFGIASIAPDSMSLPDRIIYKSPVGKDVYEKIHALRSSEINLALKALGAMPWADTNRLILAGTSEGATSVARYSGPEFMARIAFSWSCENNYFVEEHRTAVLPDKPFLNIMSSNDVFFSPSNSWLGNPAAKGHCGAVQKENKQASIVLIPDAPHTLMNLPAARHATEGFLRQLLKM
jgi:dienelactone hydrolase